MAPLTEQACADILAAAIAKAQLPAECAGAAAPQMGPPPEEGAPPAAAAAPQMGPPPEEGAPAAPSAPQLSAGQNAPAPPADGGAATAKDGGLDTRFAEEDTVFIFDWDDTVLPSTWVQQQRLRVDESCVPTPEQWAELNEVAARAKETLLAAKRYGHVMLVTNAERGWIELSCAKFLPSLAPILEDVKRMSARTSYESAQASSPLDWKVLAFEDEIRRFFADGAEEQSRWKNVLSLGDSLHERESLLRATAKLPNCRSKSLKFAERPSIRQVCDQHELVAGCIDRIVHHDGNLDLCIRC